MNDDIEELKEKIRKLNPSDFDGYTCFKELSPEQRLDWLAELVVFVYESRSFRIKS